MGWGGESSTALAAAPAGLCHGSGIGRGQSAIRLHPGLEHQQHQ